MSRYLDPKSDVVFKKVFADHPTKGGPHAELARDLYRAVRNTNIYDLQSVEKLLNEIRIMENKLEKKFLSP
jgi:hypothetical protein